MKILKIKYFIPFVVFVFISFLVFTNCNKQEITNSEITVSTIAFGSCANQWYDLSIFNKIRNLDPDLYLAMGDNMYADIPPLEPLPAYHKLIANGYEMLFNKEPFKSFAKNIPIIATWDDHDYGLNNGGKTFTHKNEAKSYFMRYYNIPNNSPIRNRNGIYNSYYFGDDEKRLQIIMLDTRWFLDVISPEPISPTSDITKTILGEEQWNWLEEELKKPAKIRIIGSSTQFAVENNGWETWANYPHEIERFYDVIRRARAEGLFFVSGDIHYAEINKREPEDLYPLYDVTSSGLTHFHSPATKSSYRVGNAYTRENFGMIRINWEANPIVISLEIYTKGGQLKFNHEVTLNELKI